MHGVCCSSCIPCIPRTHAPLPMRRHQRAAQFLEPTGTRASNLPSFNAALLPSMHTINQMPPVTWLP